MSSHGLFVSLKCSKSSSIICCRCNQLYMLFLTQWHAEILKYDLCPNTFHVFHACQTDKFVLCIWSNISTIIMKCSAVISIFTSVNLRGTFAKWCNKCWYLLVCKIPQMKQTRHTWYTKKTILFRKKHTLCRFCQIKTPWSNLESHELFPF